MGNKDIKILWVEDEINQQATIIDILEILGYSGDVAKNGKEALDFLGENSYDVLLTDLGMPEMNGWELIEIVKRQYGNQIKIIIVSGWAESLEDEKIDKNEVFAIITKPYEIVTIKNLISKIAEK